MGKFIFSRDRTCYFIDFLALLIFQLSDTFHVRLSCKCHIKGLNLREKCEYIFHYFVCPLRTVFNSIRNYIHYEGRRQVGGKFVPRKIEFNFNFLTQFRLILPNGFCSFLYHRCPSFHPNFRSECQ